MDAVLERWAPPDSTPDRTAFGWLLHSRAEVAAGRPPSRSEVEDVWRLFASFASFAGMSVDTAAVLVIELAADIDEPDLAAEPADIPCRSRGSRAALHHDDGLVHPAGTRDRGGVRG